MATTIDEGNYSSDGVEVLDLTAATPTPHRARHPTSPSTSSRFSHSSVSSPLTAALAVHSTLNTVNKRQEDAAGFELDYGLSSSDDDFDMRPSRPGINGSTTSTTATNDSKGKGAARSASTCSGYSVIPPRSAKSSASIRAGASSSAPPGSSMVGDKTGKGKGFAVDCVAVGSEWGDGVVELLSDSDDGGDVTASRLQHEVISDGENNDDNDDCQSVDMPQELEAFDSLILASQTSHMSMSQGSVSSPQCVGGSVAATADLDATKDGSHDLESAAGGPSYNDFDWDSYSESGGNQAGGYTCYEYDDHDDLADEKSPAKIARRTGGQTGGSSNSGGSAKEVVGLEVMLSKEQKALARKQATANKKRMREEAVAAAMSQVAAAKEQRERDREARKAEKERAKLVEKDNKAAKKQREQQARGAFSHLEVACVMERRFFEDAKNAPAKAGAAKQLGTKEEFMVASADCAAPGAVWWTRRAHLEGGAATDGAGVETLDLLAVVVHGDVLLGKLCQQSAAGGAREEGDLDDFPDLGNYVDSIRTAVPVFSRLILVLEGAKEAVQWQWNTRKRNGDGSGSSPLVSNEDLEDAMSWLLIHKDAETRLTKDSEETGQYIWDLTRALSAMPYKDDVTELHCVNRSKVKAVGSESLPPDEQELADAWVRMLTQVPRISDPKAIAIAQHYPLPRALVAALTDPAVPEEQRAVLLADKMGSNRHEGKLARRVFELFTQEDGDFVLT